MDHQRYRLNGVFLAATLVLSGCGGGMDFGGEVRVPAEKRHVIAADQTASKPLSLPTDRPFNIHVKQSNQNPGADGTARGDSQATVLGEAFALAEATQGGSATSEFTIGHRLDNASAQAQSVAIQVEFDLTESIEASEIPEPETLAKADLYLVILDSHQRTVAKVAMVQTTSDDAISRTAGPRSQGLAATFEPNQSYDVMLFGKVEAAAASGQKATARIDVGQIQMRFTFSAAKAQTP